MATLVRTIVTLLLTISPPTSPTPLHPTPKPKPKPKPKPNTGGLTAFFAYADTFAAGCRQAQELLEQA